MADEQKPKTIAEEAGLPENWVPLDVPPIIPANMSRVSIAGSDKYLQASLPPGYQHDTSFTGTSYDSPNAPRLSIMPLGIAGNPTTNAAIQSTSTKVVEANVAPTPEPTPTTDVDDGLIHGDAIWEIDPAYLLVRDDFNGGNTTTGTIGELGWSLFSSSGGVVLSVRGGGPLPAAGIFKIANGATANGFNNVNLANSVGGGTSGGDAFWPLFDYPVGWKAIFIFSFSTGDAGGIEGPFFVQNSTYIGLASTYKPETANGWAVRPLIFYGLRFDTSTTAPAISDTTFKFEVVNNILNSTTVNIRNNTQGTVIDTGVVPAIGVEYRLEIEMIAAGVITMSLNGSTPQTFNISTIVAGGPGSSGGALISNGVGALEIGPTAAQNDQTIFVNGSKVVIASVPAPYAAINGSWTVLTTSNSGPFTKVTPVAGSVGFGGSSNATITGFPGVIPIFSFGNDNQSTPTANAMSLLFDFFSLAWNPGVGGGTGTPISTKPRYF
jgi:hypothetical protein